MENHSFECSSFRKQYETHNTIIGNISTEISSKSPDNNYSFDESFLLEWLRQHYEETRKQEWMTDRRVVLNPDESKDVAEARNIENFDRDLSDSLVLIAVTAAYCPFLIEEELSGIYIRPRSYEEVIQHTVADESIRTLLEVYYVYVMQNIIIYFLIFCNFYNIL